MEARWSQGLSADEALICLEALANLKHLNFFMRYRDAITAEMLGRAKSAQDSELVALVREYQATERLLQRLDSDAADAVELMTSDIGENND